MSRPIHPVANSLAQPSPAPQLSFVLVHGEQILICGRYWDSPPQTLRLSPGASVIPFSLAHHVAMEDGSHAFALSTNAPLALGIHQIELLGEANQVWLAAVNIRATAAMTQPDWQELTAAYPPALSEFIQAYAQAHELRHGHFDLIANEVAQGWAWNPGQAGERVEIELVLDNAVVASGLADQWRDDLLSAGVGDGHHYFRIPIPFWLRDGKTHVLNARICGSGKSLVTGPHQYCGDSLRMRWIDLPPPAALLQIVELTQEERTRICNVYQLLSNDQLHTALKLVASHSSIYDLLLAGVCNQLINAPDPAKAAFERTATHPTLRIWAELGLGNCAAQAKQWAEAAVHYAAARDAAPGWPRAERRLHALRMQMLRQASSSGDADSAQRRQLANSILPMLYQAPDDPGLLNDLRQLLAPADNLDLSSSHSELLANLAVLDYLADQFQ